MMEWWIPISPGSVGTVPGLFSSTPVLQYSNTSLFLFQYPFNAYKVDIYVVTI
jgi:hypothetical protein